MPIARVILLLLFTCLGCAQPEPVTVGGGTSGPEPSWFAPEPGAEPIDTTQWVKIYHPEKAWSGYNLAFYKRRVPILLDMNGRVVHSWPEARAKSRLRLLPDGSLLTISLGRAVHEYDWEGNLTWQFQLEDEMPHHDVVRLANGNTMLVLRSKGRTTDDLVEVDREGRTVWRWRSARHLEPWFRAEGRNRGDITHINSVQEIPENRWFEAGDDRFRPGNLLISPRNLNAIFIVDRASGEVVWSYDRELDLQHEALMIERGLDHEGSILIFNNGYRSAWEYRKSKVIEIDPVSGEITWEYSADDFYSPTGGIEQPLPNGNILISSSRGGRAFEVTRKGEIVWQWVPPFDPNRPRRVAADHSPQLAAMPRPEQIAVSPPDGYRHVDQAVYQFSRRGARKTADINGQKRMILRNNPACSELFLPTEARLELGYGLDRQALGNDKVEGYAATFRLHLRPRGGERFELLRDTLEAAETFRRRRTIDLALHAHQWVELCVSTEGAGTSPAPNADAYVYWLDPQIRPGNAPADTAQPEAAAEPLTAEELEVQMEHLKALGYVD